MVGLILAGLCLGTVAGSAAPPSAGGAGNQDQPAVSAEAEDDLVISPRALFLLQLRPEGPLRLPAQG